MTEIRVPHELAVPTCWRGWRLRVHRTIAD